MARPARVRRRSPGLWRWGPHARRPGTGRATEAARPPVRAAASGFCAVSAAVAPKYRHRTRPSRLLPAAAPVTRSSPSLAELH
eukprot:scaffold918_cov99-Isochrysis_galbana.AAC.4